MCIYGFYVYKQTGKGCMQYKKKRFKEEAEIILHNIYTRNFASRASVYHGLLVIWNGLDFEMFTPFFVIKYFVEFADNFVLL